MSPKANPKTKNASELPPVKVRIGGDEDPGNELTFKKPFTIGRSDSCEVQIQNPGVSRRHAQVYFKEKQWWIKDLNSDNGTYVNDRPIDEIPLGKNTVVELGQGNALLTFILESFTPEGKTVQMKPPSVTQYIFRYFNSPADKEQGQHTKMIHRAYLKVQKKQRYKYFLIIGIVFLVAVGLGIYNYVQRQQAKKQIALAEQIFYSMKSLELELAQLKDRATQEKDTVTLLKMDAYREQRKELNTNYQHLLDELNFYDKSGFSETDRIIIRVARSFGECELTMPDDFLGEVYSYIKKWRTTSRLKNAVNRAIKKNYHATVQTIMLDNELPPQFFYLALQESDFNLKTIGPRTRFGIAKGFWQFIPATAKRYGLRTGPLVGMRKYDRKDERFDIEKSTRAAARYIRDIYNTEAQASGLLVIASYNWGERNIHKLVRQMPLNPRERNFWQLLKHYRKQIPKETYKYVLYIFSAAVIGEDPQLFGFDFQNPLQVTVEKQQS